MQRISTRLCMMIGVAISCTCLFWSQSIYVCAAQKDNTSLVRTQYEEYISDFSSIKTVSDIENYGYKIIEGQVFQEMFESFGEQPLTFIAAIHTKYERMAVFLADEEENIVYKTHQLETNNRILGQMKQNTKELAAVSFVDLNMDNKKDIVLITACLNETGEYTDKMYKIGDVLFQADEWFYRDYRVSDKINRFGMNKSAKCIVSYVRDGESTEFLYTATTKEELLENDFVVEEEQCYFRDFEKLGRLQVVPGIFNMGDYDVFMIYLIDENGNIVWSFQPMGDYDNLYSLRGMSGKDVDGDGMKDLVVLARYSYENMEGVTVIETACAIYYQRTGGFDTDVDFVESFKCPDNLTMSDLVNEIRAYWGWETDEVIEYLKTKEKN